MQRQAFCSALLLLSACGTEIEAIAPSSIGRVQTEIRRQIDTYTILAQYRPFFVKNTELVRLIDHSSTFQCGRGNLAYRISKVRAELTVDTTVSGSAAVSAGIPIPPVSSVALSGGFGGSQSTVQTLRYHVWPIHSPNGPPSAAPGEPVDERLAPLPTDPVIVRQIIEALDGAPIAANLLNLRNQQIVSGMYRNPITGQDNPIVRTCFTNFDPGNPSEAPGNYVDIGLTITDDRQGGITLGIGPASVGLAGKWSRTVGNSLVVYFAQPGLDTVQAASDHARAACRDGQQTSTACDRARWSLFQIVNGSIPSVGNGTGVMRGRFRTTTPASAPVPPQNTPPAGRPPTPGASNGCDDGEGDNRAVGVHRRNLPRC